MEEELSEYLVDQEFLQFIKAMKVYYWTQDLYDLHVLKKKCSDKLKIKLKLNIRPKFTLKPIEFKLPIAKVLVDLIKPSFDASKHPFTVSVS